MLSRAKNYIFKVDELCGKLIQIQIDVALLQKAAYVMTLNQSFNIRISLPGRTLDLMSISSNSPTLHPFPPPFSPTPDLQSYPERIIRVPRKSRQKVRRSGHLPGGRRRRVIVSKVLPEPVVAHHAALTRGLQKRDERVDDPVERGVRECWEGQGGLERSSLTRCSNQHDNDVKVGQIRQF